MMWAQNQCMGHGQEIQTYTPDNLSTANFSDGSHGLRITARNDGSTWPFAHDNVSAGAPQYSSGMISTSPNTLGIDQPGYKPLSFTYGFYETRMKVPAGQGIWPAAWAFPEDNIGPSELDLAEVLGNDPTTNYMTVHFNGGDAQEASTGVDLSADFHVFGMDWQPDHVSWFIDGKLARTDYLNPSNIPSKPMYAVGGAWPGAPDATTPTVSQMDIDYVRVWKR
jgi:beta-glucanase (GH16 family)